MFRIITKMFIVSLSNIVNGHIIMHITMQSEMYDLTYSY